MKRELRSERAEELLEDCGSDVNGQWSRSAGAPMNPERNPCIQTRVSSPFQRKALEESLSRLSPTTLVRRKRGVSPARIPFVFGLILAFSAPLSAQQQRRFAGPPHFQAFQEYKVEGPITRVVLRNGLTILIEEHPLHPLAAVVSHVRNDGLDGVTPTRSRLLAAAAEQSILKSGDVFEVGGRFTSSSTEDANTYTLLTPASRVMKGLEIHSRLLAPFEMSVESVRLLPASLQASRASQVVSVPGAESREVALLQELAATSDVAAILSKLQAATHRPDRTVLVIVGAVFREKILKKIVELYAKMPRSVKPPGPAKSPSRVSAPSGSGGYRLIRHAGAHARILASYPTVGRYHKDFSALRLISYILGSGRGSLLWQNVLSKGTAIVEEEVNLEATRNGGEFRLTLETSGEKIDAAQVGWLSQMEILKARSLRPFELNRAKSLWLNHHFRQLQSLETRAQLLARHEVGGDYRGRDKLPEAMASVTPADIRRVARDHFPLDHLSVVEYLPAAGETRTFDTKAFRETMQTLVTVGLPAQIADMDARSGPGGQDTEFKVPDSKRRPSRTDVKRTSILRGPEIYYQEQHDVPLVQIGYFLAGGRKNESAGLEGMTETLLNALLADEGPGGLPWEALEAKGTEIETINEPDYFGIAATVLAPYKEEVLKALIEWHRKGALSEQAVDLARDRVLVLSGRALDEQSDSDWARRQIFGDDSHGRSRWGQRDSVSRFALGDLEGWKKVHMDMIHPWIVIRGDFSGTTFLQDFVRDMSSSRYRAVEFGPRPVDPYEAAYGPAQDPVETGESLSSARDGRILLAYDGPVKSSRDDRVLEVFEGLVAGVHGHLTTILQEDAGQEVPVQISHESGLTQGAIFVRAFAEESRQEDEAEAIAQRLTRLSGAEIKPSDWSRAKVSTITDFHRRKQNLSKYTIEITENILTGKGVGFEKSYLNDLLESKRDDLTALALVYFPPEADSDEEDPDSASDR